MILGLDISTSIIGWCFLTDEGEFINVGHLDLRKEKDFYTKCDIFRAWINKYKPSDGKIKVFVEEPVKMFQSNASMAQTITKLQRFNAVCCYLVYSILETKPSLIMATSARKQAGLKVPRGGNTKKIVLQHVQQLGIIPEDRWGVKKTGNPKDWCFDQADAYIVALAGSKQ
jgi:hypothetical protein